METEINPTPANPIRFEVGKEYYASPHFQDFGLNQKGAPSKMRVISRTDKTLTIEEDKGDGFDSTCHIRRRVHLFGGIYVEGGTPNIEFIGNGDISCTYTALNQVHPLGWMWESGTPEELDEEYVQYVQRKSNETLDCIRRVGLSEYERSPKEDTPVADIARFEPREYYYSTTDHSAEIKVIARTEKFITFIEIVKGVTSPDLRRKVKTIESGRFDRSMGSEYIENGSQFYAAYNKCTAPKGLTPEERSALWESPLKEVALKEIELKEQQLREQTDRILGDARKQVGKLITPVHEVRDLTDLPEEFRSKYSALTSIFSSVKVEALKELHELLGDYEMLSPDGRTRVLVSDDISITYLPMSSVPTSKQRIEAAKGLFYSAIELHPDWRSPKKLRELFGEDILPDGRCVERWESLAQVARGSQENFKAWLDDECNLENIEIVETSENNSNAIRIFKKGDMVALLKDKGPSSC